MYFLIAEFFIFYLPNTHMRSYFTKDARPYEKEKGKRAGTVLQAK